MPNKKSSIAFQLEGKVTIKRVKAAAMVAASMFLNRSNWMMIEIGLKVIK